MKSHCTFYETQKLHSIKDSLLIQIKTHTIPMYRQKVRDRPIVSYELLDLFCRKCIPSVGSLGSTATFST